MGATVNLDDGFVRVRFAEGEHADFHLRWLRHNCDVDRHPTTGERIVCSSELPDLLSVRAAKIDDDRLEVTWEHDGRTSRFGLPWLRAHAYALGREAVPPPPNDPTPFTITDDDRERQGSHDAATRGHDASANNDTTATNDAALAARLDRALALLNTRGAAVVRRSATSTIAPEDETELLIEAFAARGLRVIGTHFGRIEDLRTDNTTNQNTDQLGYTNASIDLHTDQPFLAEPPRYQLLQCIRAADVGGDNDIVDALAAARYLRSIDEEAYEILVSTPVTFHRKQQAFERIEVAPIITRERANGTFDGIIGTGTGRNADADADATATISEAPADFRVRFSYFTMAPHKLSFARTESFYRAYDRFARLVRDPRHRVRVTLQPGDFLVYDNHRMLHARTSFQGPRWLRGVYFDR